jgi:hypothetical protein
VVNKSSIARDLENKEKKPESIAKKVIRDPELLSVLLDGFCSSIAGVRFKSAKTLVLISEQQPDILYPYFDFFSDNLTNRNNILKWNAIDVLACLTRVDTKNRFDELFERFYGMLKEGALITAARDCDRQTSSGEENNRDVTQTRCRSPSHTRVQEHTQGPCDRNVRPVLRSDQREGESC